MDEDQYWSVTAERTLIREALVEVTAPQTEDTAQPTYKTRLLALTGDTLRIERPAIPGAAEHTQPGTELGVVFADGSERWAIKATVDSVIKRLDEQKNPTHVVNLINVREPKSAQRRAHFRVGTRGSKIKRIELNPLDGAPFIDETGARCLPARMIGEVVNISGGGVGLLVDPRFLPQLEVRRDYQARLDMLDAEPAVTPIKVAHFRATYDGPVYVGLAFNQPDEAARRRFAERMHRTCVRLQQEQLRRKWATRHPMLELGESTTDD